MDIVLPFCFIAFGSATNFFIYSLSDMWPPGHLIFKRSHICLRSISEQTWCCLWRKFSEDSMRALPCKKPPKGHERSNCTYKFGTIWWHNKQFDRFLCAAWFTTEHVCCQLPLGPENCRTFLNLPSRFLGDLRTLLCFWGAQCLSDPNRVTQTNHLQAATTKSMCTLILWSRWGSIKDLFGFLGSI